MLLIRRTLATLLILTASISAAAAQGFETRATAAWVYDLTTGTVLMDKNADQPLPPASMSKLMTINMLFEALRDGRVQMDTTFPVSSRAAAMGGSTMFLQESDRPTVSDLLHGMIVNSGNDACVVVAEGLGGTEEAFAAQMTARAQALGMTSSHFANASGWPHPEHRMSMRDLGILSKRLITEFPEQYPIFAETYFNYKDRAPANANNRNPLLDVVDGADGLKTGHTAEAGYGLAGSAKQGDRRVIFVITGLTSEKERAQEAEKIAKWAFLQFSEKTLAKAGQRVTSADVWMGNASTVNLVPARDVKLLVPALVQEGTTAEVKYTGPLKAPLVAGTEVAQMIIHVPGMPDAYVPLVVEQDVPTGGFLKRLSEAAGSLKARYIDGAAG